MQKKHLLKISIIYFSICLIYFLRTVYITQPGYPLDDSWIHQVIARNLAAGYGFGFVPHNPMCIATAPLWTIVLALPQIILGPVWSGLIFGFIFGIISLAAIYKIAGIFFRDENSPLYTAILTIVCWPFVWGSISGMEIPLYIALSLWGLYFSLKSNSLKNRYSYLSYILLSLSFLSRPETGLFLGAVFIRDLIVWWRSGRKDNTAWAVKAAIIASIFGPYFLFNYSSSGDFFPHTLTAKVQDRGLLSVIFTGELRRIIKASTIFPYVYFQDFFRNIIKLNPVLFIAIVPGLIKLYSYQDIEKSKRVMLVALIVLYTPFMGALSPLHGAVYHHYRFVANLLPLAVLAGFAGLFLPVEIDVKKNKKWMFRSGIVLIPAGLTMGLLFRFVDRFLAGLLKQNPSGLTPESYATLHDFAWNMGIGTIVIGGLFICGAIIISERTGAFLKTRAGRNITFLLIFGFGAAATLLRSDTYANNVRNINECDVAAGRFLSELASPGKVVAVNDIGAIGYYSDMEILDLKGLASPEISIDMINDDSIAFEYMHNNKRVDYLVLDPTWFKYLPRRTDVLKPIKIFVTENNTILSGDTIIVYGADWSNIAEDK